jgi:hypothetical protein
MGVGNSSVEQEEGECRVVVVGSSRGDDPCLVELAHLPGDARIIATGENLEQLQASGDAWSDANVLLNVSGSKAVLAPILKHMPYLTWVHSLTAVYAY